MIPPFALYAGDCRLVLPTLAAESADSCVTDPPYELGFMGKSWDSSGVAFDPVTWRETLRVLKPGAHLCAFGGTRTFHRMTCAIEDAGFEIRDCLAWICGTGFPKSLNLEGEYEGWGTALKPAWEPIILARKPFASTVAENLARHGTGAINIDGCRIPLVGEKAPTGSGNGSSRSKFSQVVNSEGNGGNETPAAGRWPANVALDEVAAAMLNEQSRTLQSGAAHVLRRGGTTGKGMGYGSSSAGNVLDATYGDSGGASRFFYCAKVSPDERGTSDHPTMKPVALTRWLCRLVTPKGGLVLDNFLGSGSNGVGAIEEGFRFAGIELDDETGRHYREDIARPRLIAASAQPGLFDAPASGKAGG